MWHQFTPSARKAVFYAQEEAEAQRVRFVSSKHLLLGILRESDSDALQVLARLGKKKDDIVSALRRAQEDLPESQVAGDLTLTRGAKQVIDSSYDISKELGDQYIGTDHLLAGLAAAGEEPAVSVLVSFALTKSQIVIAMRNLRDSGAVSETSQEPNKIGQSNINEPTTATFRFHPDVPAEVVEEYLTRLAELYRICGGLGFSVDWLEEDVLCRVTVNA